MWSGSSDKKAAGLPRRMVFGQTEWTRLWANQIYQFTNTPTPEQDGKRYNKSLISISGLSGEKEDVIYKYGDSSIKRVVAYSCNDNRGEPSRVLRNPVMTRLSLPLKDQDWRKGKNGSCDNDYFDELSAGGRQCFETGKVRRERDICSSTIIQKHDNGRKIPIPTRTIQNDLIKKDRPAAGASWEERQRKLRKMRFENNSDLTSSGPPGKKTRVAINKRTKSIVIDGSSVAYDYGEDFCFDWMGIFMCCKYFMDFGCDDDINVVVPELKMERGMTKNFHLSEKIKKDNCSLLACCKNANYNQFLVKTAIRKDAVIISNGIWKNPNEISPNLRHFKDKTIGFHFNAKTSPKNLVISERPFGPSGPTLDEMLRL